MIFSLFLLSRLLKYAFTIFMNAKNLERLAAGGFYMRTRLYMALLLLGFLLLTACSDGGGSTEEASATACTLGISALDSCTLN